MAAGNSSCAETNFNMWERAGGAHVWKIFWSCPSTFLALQVGYTVSRYGDRFRDGQHSLVSFLLAVLLLTVSPVPSHL